MIMKMSDRIPIKGLLLPTVIGVPPEERALPQTVRVNVAMTLEQSNRGREDDLSGTVDYYEVTELLRNIASRGERQLIETLAEDLAAAILEFRGVESVTLEVEKFIIPNCGAVSVEITRTRD